MLRASAAWSEDDLCVKHRLLFIDLLPTPSLLLEASVSSVVQVSEACLVLGMAFYCGQPEAHLCSNHPANQHVICHTCEVEGLSQQTDLGRFRQICEWYLKGLLCTQGAKLKCIYIFVQLRSFYLFNMHNNRVRELTTDQYGHIWGKYAHVSPSDLTAI